MQKWTLVILLSLVACSQTTENVPDDTSGYSQILSTEAPPDGKLGTQVVPLHYHLVLEVDPEISEFHGTTSIEVKFNQPSKHIWLHGKDLAVSRVQLITDTGETLTGQYEQVLDSGVAKISFDELIEAKSGKLVFDYSAVFTEDYYGLFRIKEGEHYYVASQMQSIGARQAFPSFDDPQFKTPFDIDLIVPKGMAATTNGAELARNPLDNNRVKIDFAETRVLPTYLVAIAVGPYDVVVKADIQSSLQTKLEYPLRGFVASGLGSKMHFGLNGTYPMLDWLEGYFQSPYPYQKIDLITVPGQFGAAMENAGAITYDSWLMLLDEDASLNQKRWYTLIHIHELAHQWFGNLVTPVWWDDLWLNEAFATWIEIKGAKEHWPEGEFDSLYTDLLLRTIQQDSLSSVRPIRRDVTTNKEISNSFDDITYGKGAAVIHMFEHFIGEQDFQRGVQFHVNRFIDANATTSDFYQSIATASNMPEVIQAFASFVDQPGIPLLEVTLECKDKPTLIINQQRFVPQGIATQNNSALWQVPFCYHTEQISACELITQKTQAIELSQGTCPIWVNPNSGGMGYYRVAMSAENWRNLLAQQQSMSDKEIGMLMDSLEGAFWAGLLPAEDFWMQLKTLLQSSNWQIQSKALSSIRRLINIVPTNELSELRTALTQLTEPLLMQLNSESKNTIEKLQYQKLYEFVAADAQAPNLRATIVEQVKQYLAEPSKHELDPEIRETQLIVALEVMGKSAYNRLMDILKTTQDKDMTFAIVTALSFADNSETSELLKVSIMQDDFAGVQNHAAARYMLRQRSLLQENLDWIQVHIADLINKVPDAYRTGGVTRWGNRLCDREHKEQWQQIIETHKALLPGYENPHAQAMEEVDICIAAREQHASALVVAVTGKESIN